MNLEIQGGEVLVLIGKGGSGRTTTLRIMSRLIEPDSGSISIKCINVKKLNPEGS